MTGWRVGWLIGPRDVVKAATNLQSHATSNVANVSQLAALAAVCGDLSAVATMREAFDRRRRTMVADAERDPRRRVPEAEGAFYAYPSVKGLLGREIAGARRRRARSWPSSSSRRSRSPSCPARRSAPRATCACRTPSATTTWSRACPASSGSSTLTVPRDLRSLPKAHLHLHFTGSMRHSTLVELAARHGVRLPDALAEDWPPDLSAHRREGLVPVPAALRPRPVGPARRGRPARLVLEAAEDEAARGRAGWRSRSTRAATRRGSVGSRPSPTWSSMQPGRRRMPPGSGSPWSSRRTGPVTRSTPGPWPGSPPSTPAAGSWGSGCPTTSAAVRSTPSPGLSGSRQPPVCSPCRTAASSADRTVCGHASSPRCKPARSRRPLR